MPVIGSMVKRQPRWQRLMAPRRSILVSKLPVTGELLRGSLIFS